MVGVARCQRLPIWRHQRLTAQGRKRLDIRFTQIASVQAGHSRHLLGLSLPKQTTVSVTAIQYLKHSRKYENMPR